MARHPRPTAAEPAGASSSATTQIGVLLPASAPGALVVEYGGSGPLPARSTVAFDRERLARAIATRQQALLLFENGDPRLPIIVGMLEAGPGSALLQALLAPEAPPRSAAPAVAARFDGERLVLEGSEEITLRCGDASITLRRDGKVILRGAYVETSAKGVNRIRGGSVKIN